MTSLSDLEVVAELGWCMQIIHDIAGGRVPRYWRPPFGDCDNRVRAIAQHVFGLQTVIWNLEYVCAVLITEVAVVILFLSIAPTTGVSGSQILSRPKTRLSMILMGGPLVNYYIPKYFTV